MWWCLIPFYNTIVVKDIMSRKKLPDVMMLESVIRFTADNIGNIMSHILISERAF